MKNIVLFNTGALSPLTPRDPLSKVAERINDAIVINALVCTNRDTAVTCTQDTVDQFPIGSRFTSSQRCCPISSL